MIWIVLIIAALATVLFLSTPLLRGSENNTPSPIIISLGFAAFMAANLGTYAIIGSPELVKPGALKPYEPPPGPTTEQIQAAQQMSVEDRAQMILSMVDGLAARLEESPKDSQGWTRLLRARNVLGQTDQAEKDILRIREIFKDEPKIAEEIIKASSPN